MAAGGQHTTGSRMDMTHVGHPWESHALDMTLCVQVAESTGAAPGGSIKVVLDHVVVMDGAGGGRRVERLDKRFHCGRFGLYRMWLMVRLLC